MKKILAKERYDLLAAEVEQLMKEVYGLADVLGLEIDELPQNFPFFTLPVDEIEDEKKSAQGFFLCYNRHKRRDHDNRNI